MRTRHRVLIKLISAVVLIAVLGIALSNVEFQSVFLDVLQRAQDAGAYGRILFVFAVCLSVVALIPSVLLTLGAGALYGVIDGSLTMVLAETLGATVAFLLSRYFLHDRVSQRLRHRTRLQRIMSVLGRNDWKTVALLRMIPFFPFKLSNYYLGVTPVASGAYIAGTLLGLWPMTLVTVYLGSLAADLMTLQAGETSENAWHWLWSLGGLGFTVLIVTVLMRRITRAFRQSAMPGPNDSAD